MIVAAVPSGRTARWMELLNSGWVPALGSTKALESNGVDALWAIVAHDAWLRKSGSIRPTRVGTSRADAPVARGHRGFSVRRSWALSAAVR